MSQGITTAELAPEDEAPRPKTSSVLERARAATPKADPAKARAPKPKSSPLLRDAMMLTRRAHLYAGLLMLPWVLLYGVTGLLFNHPTWFSDQSFTPFSAGDVKGTPIEKLPSASDLASQVVSLINARSNGSYRLVQSENARFDRGGLSASFAAADGKPFTISLDPGGGGFLRPGEAQPQGGPGGGGAPAAAGKQQAGGREGMMRGGRGEGGPRGEGAAIEGGEARKGEARGNREGGPRGEQAPDGEGRPRRGRGGEGAPEGGEGRPRGGARGEGAPEGAGEVAGRGGPRGVGPEGARFAPAPFAVTSGLNLTSSPLDLIKEGLPTLLTKLGYDKAEVSDVRSAPLASLMEADGKRWQVSYNMLLGSVSGRAVEEGATTELSNRRFLLRLHMLHGYPATFGARWIWAVLVDAMSSLMIFWGISGVIMWWQIKRTRMVGGVALLFSLAAAIWVFMEMHGMMLSGGR